MANSYASARAENLEPELDAATVAAEEAANSDSADLSESDDVATARAPLRRPSTARAPLPRAPIGAASNQDSPNSRPAQSTKSVLSVGAALTIEGKVSACEVLEIEGTANISAEGGLMNIRRGGRVNGDAQVKEADIEGVFEGQIMVAGTLTIRSSGVVKGSISYGRLQVDEGGRIVGEVKIGSSTDGARGRVVQRRAEGAEARG